MFENFLVNYSTSQVSHIINGKVIFEDNGEYPEGFFLLKNHYQPRHYKTHCLDVAINRVPTAKSIEYPFDFIKIFFFLEKLFFGKDAV